MRQLGWLNSVPDPPQKQTGEPDTRSRLRRLKDGGGEPEFPEVSAKHVIGYLLEVGPTLPGGMGPAPLTHGEIASWQANTGIELTAWEACALRQLSRDYIDELLAGAKPNQPAPYMPSTTAPSSVAVNLKAEIARLAKL